MAPRAAGRPALCCPFCDEYEVDRLFLASSDLDTCSCRACGAGWDEHRDVVGPRARVRG